jgi:hypothetical protein
MAKDGRETFLLVFVFRTDARDKHRHPRRREGATRWLQRDVDCDGNSRMLSVEHVISVIDIVHIDIVSSVPNRRPSFRTRINHAKPEASELETRGTLDHYDWYVVDPKPVSTAKMRTEAIVRNAVSVVAAAFVPGAMLTLPIVCTLALPDVLPYIARSRLGPSHLVQLTMPAVLGPLDCFMLMVFVPLFTPACIISAVRWTLASVFLLVNVALVPVIFVISLAVLCVGKRRSQ